MLINTLLCLLQLGVLHASVIHYPQSVPSLIELFDDSLTSGQAAEDEWIRSMMATYPELYWYAEGKVSKTEEGRGAARPDAFSLRVLNVYYPEFDRTLMVLKSLFLLINGSDAAYEAWHRGQQASVLDRASFDTLVARVQSVSEHIKGLDRFSVYQAWIVALVLGDMGKTHAAHALFGPMGISVVDHDMFYSEVLDNKKARGELPSFARLSPKAQNLLVKTANLGHWGHITHLEGGFAMFKPLKDSEILIQDPHAFWFETVVHTCDVAGAAGHVSTQGPIVYTENTHRVLEAVYAACALLKEASEADAYYAYMAERATWAGLPLVNELDEALVRLAAMLRLVDRNQGKCLHEASTFWSPQEQRRIASTLSVAGANRLPITPTYVPAVFVNLASSKDLGATPCERLEWTLGYGVPWVASALQDYTHLLKEKSMSPLTPLNFNAIAGAVKACPYMLNELEPRIDLASGEVRLEETRAVF